MGGVSSVFCADIVFPSIFFFSPSFLFLFLCIELLFDEGIVFLRIGPPIFAKVYDVLPLYFLLIHFFSFSSLLSDLLVFLILRGCHF